MTVIIVFVCFGIDMDVLLVNQNLGSRSVAFVMYGFIGWLTLLNAPCMGWLKFGWYWGRAAEKGWFIPGAFGLLGLGSWSSAGSA